MIKYKINPKYENLIEDFLFNIKDHFSQNKKTIHKARNEIKVIPFEGLSLVVKSFKVPNFINQIAYSYIRDGKAKKSYLNAIKLSNLDVNTPNPIAYIEFYKNGLLKESFYLSLEFIYDFTIAHIRDNQPEYKEEVLEQFGKYTYEIHKKKVWHSDYSGGNVLIKKHNDKYEFSLVDINRMKFLDINGYDGLENFNKFWFNSEDLTTIAKVYAKEAQLEEEKSISEILFYDKKLKEFVENRRKWKKRLLGK
jgi:tRNA A-37 threonylcarbamoyl transferase component Bud32